MKPYFNIQITKHSVAKITQITTRKNLIIQQKSMAEDKMMRLSLVAKQINVGTATIVQFLSVKGHKVENNPNTKLNFEQLKFLAKEYNADNLLNEGGSFTPSPKVDEVITAAKKADDDMPLYFRESPKTEPIPAPKVETPKVEPKPEPEVIRAKAEVEFKVIGKIDLDAKNEPIAKPVEPKVEEVKPVAVVPEVKPEPKVEEVKPVAVVPEVKPEPVVEKVVEVPKVVAPPVVVEAPKVVTPPVPVRQPDNRERPPRDNRPNQGGNNQGQGGNNQNRNNQGQGGNNQNRNNQGQGGNNQGGNNQNRNNQGQGGNNQNRNSQGQGGNTQGGNSQNRPQGQGGGYQGGNNNQNRNDGTNRPAFVPKPQVPKVIAVATEDEEEIELIEAKGETLKGLTVLGKIILPVEPQRGGKNSNNNKKKRKRIDKGTKVTEAEIRNEKGAPRPKKDDTKPGTTGGGAAKPATTGNTNNNNNNNNKKKPPVVKKEEKGDVSDKQIQDQIKATMARLQGSATKGFGADKRREKRRSRAEQEERRVLREDEEAKILKVTEFISASELASLMDISVNEIISTCMSLGMFVSINQRLEADVIALITEEFGFGVTFVSAEEEIEAGIADVADTPEDLLPRAPIVTIMGHVDHGKTSLLDYIRRAKVAAGEAGGITQHIGAYSVKMDDGRKIAFLDTPGHEAFTAMRARGAKVTDVVIIVIAADDAVMPQTEEAINHAMNAGVPIVFAFSKVDKPGANSERVREQLSQRNILVEEWGGKYQTQEISSKSGMGIDELLEKVLLEAELLELKANPNKKAIGTVIEASLDKGRGYVTTLLVQAGTLKVGDMMLAGAHYGRVKAMTDYLGKKLKEAGPSTPVQVLGLSGAPSAGDKINSMENEREAREIANKREQIIREQSLRTRKHITLDEIGRRKAIGTFKELNVIVKGDVDGSVEALSDSLLKLSTEEVQVRIIHKGVGMVSESDVLLASAADAVIVAFQVRPSVNAKRLAEAEQIEVRTYSIIYQAIDEIKAAMQGMLAPTFEEVVTANIEVRDVFKISKIGTVAGCYVLDGTVKRAHKIRVLRDFVVVHEGDINALKRFKDDVAEVKFGYECGMSIKGFHDILVGDIFECYEMKEVKRTL
jgi:translation initiation factor IF-2